MVEAEIDHIINEQFGGIQRSTLESMLSRSGSNLARFRESFREPAVERVFHDSVVVPVVDTGDGAQALQVEVGVASFQRVEGPADQVVAQLQRPLPLQLLEGQAQAAAAPGRLDPELVAAQAQPAVPHARESEYETDHGAVRSEGGGHDSAVQLHRLEQLPRHHVALGGAPDVPAQSLAGRVFVVAAGQPDLDPCGKRCGHYRGMRRTIGKSRLVFFR